MAPAPVAASRPDRDPRPGLSGLEPGVLEAWFAERGEPAYRARQVADAVWGGRAAGTGEARTLPTALRAEIDAAFRFDTVAETELQNADAGQTEKALHRLSDGALIESVLMHYPARPGQRERHTLCISSQAGCAVGCPFCATGELGFTRDLETAEIVDQVRHAARRLAAHRRRLTNVVFMGMGEPLLNWPAVDTALTILNDAAGFGIGARHITVSTVGIVPNLALLAQRQEQFRLAVSLHAPSPELRLALMPIEKKYPLGGVLAALAQFRRRVTFEYVLIGGRNDSPELAEGLADLAAPLGALVNLLPLHPGGAPDLTPSSHAASLEFERRLKRRGVPAVLRRSRGLDIAAACGQLRVELEPRRKVRSQKHAHVE